MERFKILASCYVWLEKRWFVLSFHILKVRLQEGVRFWITSPLTAAADPSAHVAQSSTDQSDGSQLTCSFVYFLCVCFSLSDVFPFMANGDVNASKQGGIQAISLAVTLGIALLGGVIVGTYRIPFTRSIR